MQKMEDNHLIIAFCNDRLHKNHILYLKKELKQINRLIRISHNAERSNRNPFWPLNRVLDNLCFDYFIQKSLT